MAGLHSFLWLNHIPLEEYSTFFVSSPHLMNFGLLSLLGYMDNVAFNICVQVFASAYVFMSLDTYLGMKFGDDILYL